jgi:DNA mismatch repair protein MutH
VNVETALKRIQEIEGIPLGKLFTDITRNEVSHGHINKGYAGQILELVIGLDLSVSLNDLTDGEIKTTILRNNRTREWIPITVLNHLLGEMVNNLPWEQTKVYKKIRHFILVPCHKDSKNWQEWHFAAPIRVSAETDSVLNSKFKEDYEYISSQIRKVISTGQLLHTTSGPNYYLQIRTKDNPPYKPFLYEGKVIGNKKYAIGLTSRFVRDLVNEHRGTQNPRGPRKTGQTRQK